MRRPLTLPLLLLLVASASAADVKLVFEDASERIAFGADAVPEAPPTDALRTTKREVSVAQNGKNAIIIEPGRNLVYVIPWTKLATSPKITRTEATHAYKVTVEVDPMSAQNHPIDVQLKVADGTRTVKVGQAEGYRANFTFIPLGPLRLTVSDFASSPPIALATPATLDAATLANPVVLSTAIPREVTSAGTTPATSPTQTTAPLTGGTILGNLFSLVIGLAVVGGLAFAAWRYARANPERVSEALGKIGADVPKPLDPDDPPPATPATTPAPAAVPSGPIILDPTPTPISVPQTQISLGAAATGVPKLIGSDGSAFDLPEGETVVGREALGGLMITHDTVSRRHARLLRSGGSVSVEDLGSTNGTWVNDAPASSSAPASLIGGESVRFGQVAYRYEA